MGKVEDNIENKDGIIDVVSSRLNAFDCHYDQMVATLWSTIYFIKIYPKVNKISYLVQNFETNFMEYGDYGKQRANSTYSLDDVNYLTISKWFVWRYKSDVCPIPKSSIKNL